MEFRGIQQLRVSKNYPRKATAPERSSIKHPPKDQPFNDHRYAVDGTKLRQLSWEQKTTFEGLKITADLNRNFPSWLGDITAAPGDPRTREESLVPTRTP